MTSPNAFFFFNDTATTEIYTLSLHDALPISLALDAPNTGRTAACVDLGNRRAIAEDFVRSEEHTSELQSRLHLVCRLLLEKKKKATAYQLVANTAHYCRVMHTLRTSKPKYFI